MVESRHLCSCQAHAVDEARVVQLVRIDSVFTLEQGREGADVELKSGGEEHRVGLSDEFSEPSLDSSVDGVFSGDQARGPAAGQAFGAFGQRCRGETEIVVAAKADDAVTIERVTTSLASLDGRQASFQSRFSVRGQA